MKSIFPTIFAALILVGAGCAAQESPVQSGAVTEEQAGVRATSGTINLSGQGLIKLPESVLKDAEATTLDISNNLIGGALPAEIRQMRSLRTLDASGNRMTGVPAEIGQLQELRVLDLSNNLLTGLPYELGNLKKLEVLDLSGNSYSTADLEKIRSALPATTVIKK